PWNKLVTTYGISEADLKQIVAEYTAKEQKLEELSEKITAAAVNPDRFFDEQKGRCNWEALAAEFGLPLLDCLRAFNSAKSPHALRSMPEPFRWSQEDRNALLSLIRDTFDDPATLDWSLFAAANTDDRTVWTKTDKQHLSDLISKHNRIISDDKERTFRLILPEFPNIPENEVRKRFLKALRGLRCALFNIANCTRLRQLVSEHGEDWERIDREMETFSGAAQYNWGIVKDLKLTETWSLEDTKRLYHSINTGMGILDSIRYIGSKTITQLSAMKADLKRQDEYLSLGSIDWAKVSKLTGLNQRECLEACELDEGKERWTYSPETFRWDDANRMTDFIKDTYPGPSPVNYRAVSNYLWIKLEDCLTMHNLLQGKIQWTDDVLDRVTQMHLPSFVFDFAEKHSCFGRDASLAAMTEESVSLSYGEMRQLTERLASGLVNRLGLKRGDVLLVLLPNTVYYAPILLGAQMVGLVCATANPAYTETEIVHLLKLCTPKVVVTVDNNVSLVESALRQTRVDVPRERILSIEKNSNGPSIFDILSGQTFERVRIDKTPDMQNTPAFIVLSSGTTGMPKGVVLSHGNIISNLLQNLTFEEHDAQLDMVFRRAQSQTTMACLPFFHIYALLLVLLYSVIKGRHQIIMPKYDIELFCRLVEKHRVTLANLVPPIIIQLAKSPVVDKYDLTSLAYINSGAAPLACETQNELQKRLGCIVTQAYGLSETSPVSHRAPAGNVPAGSIGYLLPSMQCRIIDDDGKPLGTNEAGEICLRGPNVMLGYLNDPEATAKTMDEDGFFHTGDIGYVDNRGRYYISDRKKELIKYKGFQVAPAELEGLLMDHPAVLDAAVIPVYNRAQETEVPKAFVVVRPEFINLTLTSDIASHVASHVADYKALRGGIEIVNSIPKSPSGKILRRLLREREGTRQKLQFMKAKI
ncbi:hypothetical protein GGI15_004006, partial [Coemansia interrupta]